MLAFIQAATCDDRKTSPRTALMRPKYASRSCLDVCTDMREPRTWPKHGPNTDIEIDVVYLSPKGSSQPRTSGSQDCVLKKCSSLR